MDGTGRDPSERVFFLSYPRPLTLPRTTKPVQDVREFPARFFDDVNEIVADLLGTGPGENPGYLDIQTRPGAEWTPRLRREIGTCQVFVPLLSRRWQDSHWCQLEWKAFRERQVLIREAAEPATDEQAVLPVLWAPHTPYAQLRNGFDKIQWFVPYETLDAGSVTAYLHHGVHGLLVRRLEQPYQDLIWFLARAIAETREKYQVVHRIPPESWSEADSTGTGQEGGV